jgi:protein phosphatase methylesterase 1
MAGAYWDSTRDIQTESGKFRVYIAGNRGPSILLLHGAGHSAVTWSLLAARLKLHCTLYAIDLRGHGATETSDDSQISISTLTSDVLAVLDSLLHNAGTKTRLMVVGHSMGGALAVHVSLNIQPSSAAVIAGVVVIDVVEGTALAALDSAKQILNSRPQRFDSPEEAVEWAVASGTLLNIHSAQISIPDQLMQESALVEGAEGSTECTCASVAGGRVAGGRKYIWRTDLCASEQYWHGWFADMSALFLSLKVPKMLMVAGTNRLDTPLTIAQVASPLTRITTHAHHHPRASPPTRIVIRAYFVATFRSLAS